MMWEKVNLSNVAEVIAGQSPESKYYNNVGNGIPFFQGKADFGLDYPTVRYWCTQPTKIAKPLDILFSVRAPVGPTNICDIEACIGRGLASIRVGKKLDYKFLYFYLKSIEKQIASQGNGSTFSAITTSVLKELQIPLPPLPIQKRIAEILDTADTLRRKDEALLKKYDELAQAIFIDMFGDPVKNEKGWEVKKLGEVTSLITDGKHGNCNDENTSGYYFISAKDIFDEKIHYSNARQIPRNEFEEVDRRTNLQSGDIVMVNTGATIGKLAIAKDIPETRKTTFQKSVAVIKLKPEFITNYFLKYVFLLRINSFSNKGNGSAVQNLLLSEMREFKIILPKATLQNSFTEKIKNLEEQKSILQSSLNKKNNLFNSLLQKAFNGELVA